MEKLLETPAVAQSKKPRGFYGWIALAGAVISLFISGGAFSHSFGVFLPVIVSEFGWSRAEASLAVSLGILAFGLPSPFWGILVAKYGPKKTIIVGNIMAALGLAGVSLIQEVWQLYFLFIFAGLGCGIGGYISTTTLANNWFIKRIAFAMGLISAAGGMSGFVFPPLTSVLISTIGWRLSYVVLGSIVLIGAVLIGGILMIRNRPEDMGQSPDGISAERFIGAEITSMSGMSGNKDGLKIKDLAKLPATWLIALFGLSNAMVIGTMATHQVAYLRDLGYSSIVGATTMSVWSASSIVFSIAFGTLALKYNLRYLSGIACLTQLAALIILILTKELALLYVYSALVGAGIGALVAALPTFVGAYYGRARYARVMGLIFTFHVIALAAGGTVAGMIYDATSTYLPAFVIVMAFSLLGLFSVIMVRKPKLD